MTSFTAFNASKKIQLSLRILNSSPPNFETSYLFVSIETAPIAFNDICFNAVNGEVTNLVTFKANFLGA
jgi:hypothetical protein